MKSLASESVVQRSATVTWRVVGEEGILLNLKNGFYYGINPTGIFVWKNMDGRRGIGEIAKRLQQQYSVPVAEAEKDVLRWVSKLLDVKLVERREKKTGMSSGR